MKRFLLSALVVAFFGTMLHAQTDPAVYPKTADGDSLMNVYLNSATIAGKAVLPAGKSGSARGMTLLDGKMYIINRTGGGGLPVHLVELNGENGELLNDYELPDDVFKAGADTVSYPGNDVQRDEAGNLFVGNMTLDMRSDANAVNRRFRVSYVDVTKSPIEFKVILDATLPETVAAACRVETFDVYGDVKDGDGLIMMPISGNEVGAGNFVIKYTVTGGVADVANPEFIEIKEYYPASATTNSYAPRVNIVDNTLFYADGFSNYASLYDMSGNMVDGFKNNPDLAPLGAGQNGVTEFEMNGKYYLVVASTNTNKTPPQAFDIFQFKDANRAFADMKLLYRFPEAGMGAQPNSVRTALPRVEIQGTSPEQYARINLYAYQNGYGVYHFGPANVINSIEEMVANDVSISITGNLVRLSKDAKEIKVYNLAGQKIYQTSNTNMAVVPAKGVYIVKAKFADKSEKAFKVIVK